MSDIAIKVHNLSKAYRIGLKESQHDTLGSAVVSWLKSPARNLRNLRNLRRIGAEATDSDIFWALKDINFEVKRGEVLGIIGKNGAGKSTLLKILSRITEPTTGEIEIYGRVASLLEVGTGFNPELTGRENIYLNGTILGMTKKEISTKFDEIVDFSGVEQFIDTPVKRYSSGMRVRLAFAVAAHLDPEILIIDEVLAVGDAEFQKKCLGKMQDVSSREGRTVLFVSHDLNAVNRLCRETILLNKGKMNAFSETNLVIDRYLNPKEDYDGKFDIKIIDSNSVLVFIQQISDTIGDFNEGTFFVKLLDFESREIMLYSKKIKSIQEIKSKRFEMDISILNGGVYSIQSKLWGTYQNGKNLALSSNFYPFSVDKFSDCYKGIFAPEIEINDR